MDVFRSGEGEELLQSRGRSRGDRMSKLEQVLQGASEVVVFSACSKLKQDTACEARDFYRGQEHKYVRRAVDSLRERGMSVVWYIISAKHGVVSEQDVLQPYDVVFPRSKWKTRRMAEEMGISKDYRRVLGGLKGIVVIHIIGEKYMVALGYPMKIPEDCEVFFLGSRAISKMIFRQHNVHIVSVEGVPRTAKSSRGVMNMAKRDELLDWYIEIVYESIDAISAFEEVK